MVVFQIMGMRSQKYGGLEKYIVQLSELAKENNDSLFLFYEEYPTEELFIKRLLDNNVTIIQLPSRGGKLFSYIFRYAYYVFKFQPDVVHSHFNPAGYLSIFISKLLGVKVIFRTIHSLLGNGDSSYRISFRTKILKYLEVRCVTKFFCVSKAAKDEYDANFFSMNKSIILYLGVDTLFFSSKKSSDYIDIACIAFHGHIKGIDVLLKALNIIVHEYEIKNIRLFQIGKIEGEYSEELFKLASGYSLTNFVYWLNIRNDVPNILATMDIYCQPSRSEGVPLALMEASMQGLPLVGANVGGIPEVLIDGYNGYLFQRDDCNDLVNKLLTLIDDQSSRINLGENARMFACEKFSLKSNVSALYNYYKHKSI